MHPSKLIAAFVFFYASFTNVFAQNGSEEKDPNSKADTTKTQVDNSVLNEILEYIKKDKENSREPTGVFYIIPENEVSVYNPKKGNKREMNGNSIKVDKVTMLIQDGYIVDIQIFSGNDIFTNTQALISIDANRFSDEKKDFLYNKRNFKESIIMQDAVFYDPIKSFFPEDGVITLYDKHTRDTVQKNVGVNTVLDVRLYTDALASLGKEPNGIFQTDVRLKQFLHRRHVANSGRRYFGYFKINFTASKLDSKFSYVDSSDNLPRTQLYQKSKLSGELALNVRSSWLTKKTLNNYYLDVGAGYYTTMLARSKDTISIHVTSIFTELGINLKNSSNIGVDFAARLSFQYSPQTDFNDQHKVSKFLRLGTEIYWNPFDEPANRVFGRINYMMGVSSKEKKNNFSQVQIGYSLLVSKALGKGK